MKLPQSISFHELNIDELTGAASHATAVMDGAGGSANPLSLTMQTQTQSNWCWAAVGTSIGLFFQTGTWTQCSVACGVLDIASCCTNPSSPSCNVYGFLDKSLTYTKSFASMLKQAIGMSDIVTKISHGTPVCLRCAWNGGGAHFITIYGYNQANGTVNVADSIYGYSTQVFNTFPSHYQGGGTWTTTYFTSKN